MLDQQAEFVQWVSTTETRNLRGVLKDTRKEMRSCDDPDLWEVLREDERLIETELSRRGEKW